MYYKKTPAGQAWETLDKQMTPAISYGAVRKAAFEKLGVKNMKDFLHAVTQAGVNPVEHTKRNLLQAAALDDWDSVWSYIKPHAMTLGKGALKLLLTKALGALGGGAVSSLLGGDEGFNPIDWPGGANLATSPYKQSLLPGVNIDTPATKTMIELEPLGSESVSIKAIASVISPETQKFRYAYIESTKTALAVVRAEFNVSTGSNGQFGINFNAYATSASFGNIHDNGFDVTTGLGTSATPMINPIAGLATAAVEVIRISSVSIQFTPIASLNTAGALTMAYNTRTPASAPNATDIKCTLTAVQTWPYVTSFNVRTPMRMIPTASDSSTDDFAVWNAPYTGGRIIVLGSGLPGSTVIGRVIITQNLEFIPTNAYFPICPVDWPYPGPATEQFESYMFTRFPVLQSLDLQDAQRVANALGKYDSLSFRELTSILSDLLAGIVPRLYVPHAHPDSLPEVPAQIREVLQRSWDPEMISMPNNGQLGDMRARQAALDSLPYFRANN